MIIFRMVYLVSVLVGLCINFVEYQHAKWVCKEVWDRQMSPKHIQQAKSFMGEELLRVWVQALLMVPAVVGFSLPYVLSLESRHMLAVALDEVRGLIAASHFAHITASVLLTVKSIRHRRDRLSILSVSKAAIREREPA